MTNFVFDLQRFVEQRKQSVHSGNTVLLKVNGEVVGRAQSLDGRRSFGTEGVYEIGSIMPQEHINNRYEGTVALERFLIKKADLAKVGMAALGEEILATPVIDIEVIDKVTGKCVRVYRGCTAVDYSENFRVGAISGENATFQYLSCDRNGDDEGDYVRELNTYYFSGMDVYTNASNYTYRSGITSSDITGYKGLDMDNNWVWDAKSSVDGGNGG